MLDDARWCYPPHAFSDPTDAQRTVPVHHAKVLDVREVEQLRAAAVAARERNQFTLCRPCDHGGEYRTTWLQGVTLPSAVARIIDNLVSLMKEADVHASWGLLLDQDHEVRCIEFHEYVAGQGCDAGIRSGAPDMTHYDAGSLVTLDLMLSDTKDFEGGSFATPEQDGTLQAHSFEQGDVLVFVSHKYHHVSPVTSGTRAVLVIELWRGPRRTCAHRCLNPMGDCHFSRAALEGIEEFLPFVST